MSDSLNFDAIASQIFDIIENKKLDLLDDVFPRAYQALRQEMTVPEPSPLEALQASAAAAQAGFGGFGGVPEWTPIPAEIQQMLNKTKDRIEQQRIIRRFMRRP